VVSYASLETEPKSVPPGPAQSRTPLLIAAAIAVALLVALTLYLRPSTGRLDVTVAGPGNLPIDSVQVIVNGKVVCETSPCTVNDLPANTYHVQAKAPGYHDTAVLSVLVTGGQGAVHNVSMVRASGTGIRVKAEGTGLRLFVDDREVGPLPQELKDLAPGEHKVRVQGEHFETWEQTVVVQANEIQTVGPLALKVIKGLAMIKDGGNASDARVVLESGEDRRSLPTLPINLHIDTSKPHTLIATKEGFETFTQALRFEAGQAERTFEVRLVELPAPEDEARPQVAHRRRAPRPVAPSTPDETVASAGKATLNFNSIPASAVVLDGRPIGRTPKLGVAVSAGKHTVVFLEQGQRVSKSVSVAAGESKTVIHRFE
jgi:serine/threonine-protein kinase